MGGKNSGPPNGVHYSEEIAEKICQLMETGMPVVKICAQEGFPVRGTLTDWAETYPEFGSRYARAKILQADAMVDEGLEIIDTPPERIEATETQPSRVDSGAVQHIRNRVAYRQWLAARRNPDVYGDKPADSGPQKVLIEIAEDKTIRQAD